MFPLMKLVWFAILPLVFVLSCKQAQPTAPIEKKPDPAPEKFVYSYVPGPGSWFGAGSRFMRDFTVLSGSFSFNYSYGFLDSYDVIELQNTTLNDISSANTATLSYSVIASGFGQDSRLTVTVTNYVATYTLSTENLVAGMTRSLDLPTPSFKTYPVKFTFKITLRKPSTVNAPPFSITVSNIELKASE